MSRSITFSTDSKLRITSWGKNIALLTGKPFSTVKGKKYYEVLPRIYDGNKDALHAALKNKSPLSLKSNSFNCPVNQIEADIKITPLKAANGNEKAVKVFITPPLHCPAASKYKDLQMFIDIGRTASTLAHGIRSPLNAIKGAVVYIVEKHISEPAILEFTKIIEDEISRLDEFISKFLSASLYEEESSEADINSLLNKIKILTSFHTRANNIEAVYVYAKTPLVVINSFQIKQAVLNIVDNAIDAMREGGRLTVRSGNENVAGKEFVVIEVSDTGPGISGYDINKIEFSREKGRGFGLFIAREIIRSHGGRMEIKSRKNTGTNVKLYIPAKNSSQE